MVQISRKKLLAGEAENPLIGITMFGFTTPCLMKIKKRIEEEYKYHDAIVFHARGTGGRAMEELNLLSPIGENGTSQSPGERFCSDQTLSLSICRITRISI